MGRQQSDGRPIAMAALALRALQSGQAAIGQLWPQCAHAGHSAGVQNFPNADTAPRGAVGGGWRKPDFQSVRGPSLGMPGGNSLLAARKAVMLTMPQTIDSKVPDAEEWMS